MGFFRLFLHRMAMLMLAVVDMCGHFGQVTGNDPGSLMLSTSVFENATIGTTIFQLSDNEILTDVTIRIISGNMDKRFAIDPTKSVIYLAGYLDYDLEKEYWSSIGWNNESDYSVTLGRLHVTVIDVIDWPPVYNDSCVFDKRKVDAEWYYPFPFAVEYFYPGSTLRHFVSDRRGHYDKSNVRLSNSLCHADIINSIHYRVMESLPYLNISCQHGNAKLFDKSDIDIYKKFEDIPLQDRFTGNMFQPSPTSLHLRSILSKETINKELTCVVDFLTGYKHIPWIDIEAVQQVFGDNLSLQISAVIDYIGCPDGKYGGRCQYDCICENGATCHVFNGACKCPPGWSGVACDIASPYIEISPHGFIEADFGEYLSLECVFNHLDQSQIFNSSWMRDNESIEFGRYGGIYAYERSTPLEEEEAVISLDILSVRDNHAGRYQCLVTDINGEQYRDEITIKVTGCTVNHWGINCDRICDCQNGGNCTRSLGCVCQHGWGARNCSIDIEPPRFTFCPSNLSQTVETDIASIEVTWPLPEVIDNSDDVNVTSNFDPGDEFTIDTHPVIYTAKDAQNNTAECRFSVFLDRKSTISRTVIISLSIAAVVAILLLVVFGFLCFCNRRKILLKYTILTGKVDDESSLDKKWDAFVACKGNSEEETFVYKALIPELEEKHGYTLNAHHKDFLPGEAICTNILDAITKSRRTILVMSPSFVRSGWCIYELEQAYHEMIGYRHKLIPIMFEDITDMPDLPPILQTILTTISYIDWPKYGNQKDKDRFWKRLVKVMPKKRKRAPNPCVRYMPLPVGNEEAQIQINTACV